MVRVLGHTFLLVSVVCAPVAVITGHQAAGDEQNQVHKPPDPQASQGEQLPHSGAGVTQAEAVDPETTKEEGVQQSGDEVVSSVSVENQRPNRYRGQSEQEGNINNSVQSNIINILLFT